jgi:Protein of unknown function (DUF3987)
LIPPYQSFPLESLPPVARGYVRQGASALGCDPAFVALPVLAALASAIGNTRTIRLKRGWTEPSIVWTATVGDSGTLKSPAHDLAIRHLYTVQERLLAEFKQGCAAHQDGLAQWKAAKKEGKDPGEKPESPVFKRVIASDTTIEKLAEILEDNTRGTLVARDELSAWIGSFTKYKGRQGGSDVPNWLELNRGGTLIVDRKTGDRRTLFVKRAAASVCGGIQPGVLAKALTSDLLDSGLVARLLLCWPPRLRKKWSEAEIDPETERAYQDLLDRLLKLDFDKDKDVPRPRVLRLSEEARTVWVRFYDEWAREQAAVEGELSAAYSKLEAYVARFALLYHVVSHAISQATDATPVEAESIEAGIKLARWFAHEARRIYATLSESTGERDTRRLLDFIRSRGGEITANELWKSNNRRYGSTADAERELNKLLAAGLGDWFDGPSGAKGGRPTRVFRLCTRNPETSETSPGEHDENTESAPETTIAPQSHAENTEKEEGFGGFGVSGAGTGEQEGGVVEEEEVSGTPGVSGAGVGSRQKDPDSVHFFDEASEEVGAI